METIVIKAIQLILSLSILVIIHELGHFTFAKLFKVRVEKFYLFFDAWFALFRWQSQSTDENTPDTEAVKQSKWLEFFKNKSLVTVKSGQRETEYGIGWLPLGGYVKISGMIDESMDKEALKQPVKAYEFRAKPAWQRLLIMVGGVFMNFLLAFFIYAMVVFSRGERTLPMSNLTGGLDYSTMAHNAGFEDGDLPVKADGVTLQNLDTKTLFAMVEAHAVEVLRDGQLVMLHLPVDFKNIVFDKEPNFVPRDSLTLKDKFEVKHYSFLASFPAGVRMGVQEINNYIGQFKYLFSSKGAENIGGFGAIGNLFPSEWNWLQFWRMTAFLSIMLGVMNILPIPALDGGHVLFLVVEVVTRRKPSDKFLEQAQVIGMTLLIGLLIYANGMDVIRAFFK
ncbi:MAG: site-2 protease family protein [Candidatus Symbiothrix sp.]|nr:site-2 protease family protein [Candidatus Symbiothrix sp.]